VGQSSWGPAVYGIVADCGAAGALAAKVRGILGVGGSVYDTGFSTAGARVWRAAAPVSA
jgi:predicted sugar kinase